MRHGNDVNHFTEPDLIVAMDNEAKGKPIGRPAEVGLRNTHLQYVVTWFVVPKSF